MAKQAVPQTRIIWAVDPFAPQGEVQRASAMAIQAIVRRQPAVILPVYVASDPRHQIPPKLRAQYNRELAAEAQDEIDSWVGTLNGPRLTRLEPVHVLGPTGSSLREQVRELLDYAKVEDADLIVASTRARRGPPRWFFGSFVETLTLTSDLPLLVVNPHWALEAETKPSTFDRILFPTDFSDESHVALLRLLPFARKMKSHVTLFHKLSMGLAVMPEAAISMIAISEEARQADLDLSRRNAEAWSREACRAGVKTDAIIDFREGESVPSAILKESRRTRGLIAMAGESNRLESRLLGSVTRQILRESYNPVWVLHPPAEADERRLARRAA